MAFGFLTKGLGKLLKGGSKVAKGAGKSVAKAAGGAAVTSAAGGLLGGLTKGLTKGLSSITNAMSDMFSPKDDEYGDDSIKREDVESVNQIPVEDTDGNTIIVPPNQEDDNEALNKSIADIEGGNQFVSDANNLAKESDNLSNRAKQIVNQFTIPATITKPQTIHPRISSYGTNSIVLEPEQVAQKYAQYNPGDLSQYLLKLIEHSNELSQIQVEQLTIITKLLQSKGESELTAAKKLEQLMKLENNKDNSLNEQIKSDDNNVSLDDLTKSKESVKSISSNIPDTSSNSKGFDFGKLMALLGIGLPLLNGVLDKWGLGGNSETPDEEQTAGIADRLFRDENGEIDKSKVATVAGLGTAGAIGGKVLANKLAKKAATQAVETTVEKTTAQATLKTLSGKAKKTVAAKIGAKLLAKAGTKSLLKKLPGIGLLTGAGLGIWRLSKGDYIGALGELSSGAASTIPGLGTAVSTGIDVGLAVRDGMNEMKKIETTGHSDQLTDEELEELLKQPTEEEIEQFNYLEEKKRITNENDNESLWDKAKYTGAKLFGNKEYVAKVDAQREINNQKYQQQINEIDVRYKENPESFSYTPSAPMTSSVDGVSGAEYKSVRAPQIKASDSTKSNVRASRNNNPGNINKGIGWVGEVPVSQNTDGRFAQFSNMGYGFRALFRNLRNYKLKYGIDTVRGAINRWAPPFENNTAGYINTVAKNLGVKPDDKVDLEDKNVAFALADSIYKVEAGKGHVAGKKDLEFGWATLNDTKEKSPEEVEKMYGNLSTSSAEPSGDGYSSNTANVSTISDPNVGNNSANVSSNDLDTYVGKLSPDVKQFQNTTPLTHKATITKDEESESSDNSTKTVAEKVSDDNSESTNKSNQNNTNVIKGGDVYSPTINHITNVYTISDAIKNNEVYN